MAGRWTSLTSPSNLVQDRSQQAALSHGAELAAAPGTQQTTPPLDSGVEQALPQCGTLSRSLDPPVSRVKQADPMDIITTIFNDLMQSVKAFSGKFLGDFKHLLGHD